MDTTRTFGMQAMAFQGQSGLGSRLRRTINTQVFACETKDYALGIVAENKNQAHYTRSNIGIETFIHVVQESIVSPNICVEELTTNDAALKDWAQEIQHSWFHVMGVHYDHNPLTDAEKTLYNKAEQDYIYRFPEYIYRFMVTLVIESDNGVAVVHTGNAHPFFVYPNDSAPIMHQLPNTSWFGNPEDDGYSIFSQVIPISRPRVVTILNDSLYRAMPANYLTNIHRLLGYYPELAEQYIKSQMPLLSAAVDDDDLAIVVMFDQDPLAHKSNYITQ